MIYGNYISVKYLASIESKAQVSAVSKFCRQYLAFGVFFSLALDHCHTRLLYQFTEPTDQQDQWDFIKQRMKMYKCLNEHFEAIYFFEPYLRFTPPSSGMLYGY